MILNSSVNKNQLLKSLAFESLLQINSEIKSTKIALNFIITCILAIPKYNYLVTGSSNK